MTLTRVLKSSWWLSIAVVVCLVGCKTSPPVESRTITEDRKAISIDSLDPAVLQAVDTSSSHAASAALNDRPNLKLVGTVLTVGPVGSHQTAVLVANTLDLTGGSQIITNGNNLSIVANQIDFDQNGGITSFVANDQKAAVGQPGLNGGTVDVYALKGVTAKIQVTLTGQAGGDGAAGGQGAPGSRGTRGADASSEAFGCGHGGGDGGQGTSGGKGLTGGDGQQGGNGGDLVLRGEASTDHLQHFSLSSAPGAGGTGGGGGPGGPGGPGGEGGSGGGYCGGGHPGNSGPGGPPGDSGKNGPSGASAGDTKFK